MNCCNVPYRFDVPEYRISKDCLPAPRLSAEEWKLATFLTTEAADAERQVAEHVHAESVRVREEADETTRRAHADVEWRFQERLADTQHWREELSLKFGEINNEIDAQRIYRKRLENSLVALDHIVEIDGETVSLRNGRLGVDLVHDEPQKHVILEMKIVEGIKQVLSRTAEYTIEQIRLLRKTAYNLNKELLDKDKAIEIDRFAHSLNVHRSEVHTRCPALVCDVSVVDEEDWEEMTMRNKLAAQKAINASIQLRTDIDSLLRQSAEDVQKQVCDTNRAFHNRLNELIEAKESLQKQHLEISINIREMEGVICSLGKAFEEKKSAAALAETRLNVRCRRPNMELVKDAVQRGLLLEVQRINEAMAKINTKILQTKNVLRNLCRNQLELEDAINVKMNSIGIDEARVMVLRKSILVQEF